jgi:L-serine dehydratase
VIEIDGHTVSMLGDCYETLVYVERIDIALVQNIEKRLDSKCETQVLEEPNKEKSFIRIKTLTPLNSNQIDAILTERETITVKFFPPVLPVLNPKIIEVPFGSCEQMLAFNKNRQLSLAELAIQYESTRGGLSRETVVDKMVNIVRTMRNSLNTGLAGTRYKDRILGCQSTFFREKHQSGQLLDLGVLNRIIPYVTALMEVKSAMGVIVAAPTAGSCGGLPGAVIGAADAMGCHEDEIAKAMLAAGMIGVFISTFSTFAAEVAGCQAECGAGSGMAAAAIVTLMGGTTEISVAAASMALQNSLGMICDPVANRVEVPCLGKNVMAASNAVSCANMALAGYDPVIPLDEVIHTMDAVGKRIPCELRCTALGGLSMTETSKRILHQIS